MEKLYITVSVSYTHLGYAGVGIPKKIAEACDDRGADHLSRDQDGISADSMPVEGDRVTSHKAIVFKD